MTALPKSSTVRRAPAAMLARALLFLVLALGFAAPARAADPVKGDVKVYTDGGYTRLKFQFESEVDATVRLAAGILVISFKKPVDVAVDRINAAAPDYVSAARRDPDRTAIRLALARKVKINTIPAGEWLFVDLLPDDWKGVMPGLPQEIVEELTRRAREAEKLLHKERVSIRQQEAPTIRVRVVTQPTFTRYVFELPASANVTPERGSGRLTLSFDRPAKWDLADAKATLPAAVQSIEAEGDYSSSTVNFALNGTPQVRTFREDNTIVVDVDTAAKPKAVTEPGAGKPAMSEAGKPTAEAVPTIAPPETVPVKEDAKIEAKDEPKDEAKSESKDEPKPEAKPVANNAAPVVPALPAPAAAAAKPDKSAVPPVAEAAPKAPVLPDGAEVKRPAPNPNAPVVVELHRAGDTLRLDFPFAVPTPAAVLPATSEAAAGSAWSSMLVIFPAGS